MGYSTISEVELVLAQALTSASPDLTDDRFTFINIGEARDLNRIDDDVVNYYISLADSQIDGILSQQYYTPLKKCVNGQWMQDSDIDEYNQLIH